MNLNKEEAKWLDDKWNDFFYYFQVEDMFEKDQKIYQSIGEKLSEVILNFDFSKILSMMGSASSCSLCFIQVSSLYSLLSFSTLKLAPFMPFFLPPRTMV